LLAAKIGQILHAWRSESATQISEQTMRVAVAKTKALIRESDANVNEAVGSDRKSEANEQEARMLAKLRVHGALSDRDLQRKYKRLPLEEREKTLDSLLEKGQARRREDGLIEAVRHDGDGERESTL